jgi:hypothetical protein
MNQYTEKLQMLRKEAAGPAAAAFTAAGLSSLITSGASKAYDFIKNDVVGMHKWLSDKAYITLPLIGLAGAYVLAKMSEPKHITDNSDDILYLNALKTETAAARRQIKAIEAEARMKGSSRKVFDKFLG